ncbi:uncharacterized protein PpBr36_11351 [Pyricularia pennisetigena]|uniref:uncharacterized protein n=1 Tax=Pyricularia pennisetigena TaxID=1578925 RepID=UPI00115416FF|nr:uncharacterized protein PpBr36_11351 [Pyricularia pennisetigena]TLS20473.1 hypothetical protein PpBr36_11351 [Pyricularia pennisetigena]
MSLCTKPQPGDSRLRKNLQISSLLPLQLSSLKMLQPNAGILQQSPRFIIPSKRVSCPERTKGKKGKSIAMDEPASPPTEDPDLEPISLAESLLDKTFLLTHCHVYALAEYLQVGDLKVLAAGKFRAEAEKQWNHPDFFEAVQEVYRTSVRSDRLLRDIVVDVMKQRKELLDRFEYQDVVSQLDLSFELLMAVKTRGWG